MQGKIEEVTLNKFFENQQNNQQNQNQPEEQSTKKNLEIVREAIKSKSRIRKKIKIGDTEYTFKMITPIERFQLQKSIKEALKLDSIDDVFQQFDKLKDDEAFVVSVELMKKVLIEIDGFSLKDVFLYEGSPFKSIEEGLTEYLSSPAVNLVDIISGYFDFVSNVMNSFNTLKKTS